MAKRNNPTAESEERTDILMYGNEGNLRLRIGSVTKEYEEDGRDVSERIVENVETSQGTFWNSTLLMRQGPDRVTLATCDKCEEETRSLFRRSHSRMTLSPAPDMRRCYRCRANLCQKHVFAGLDNRPRCRRCHRWHLFWHKILLPICSR